MKTRLSGLRSPLLLLWVMWVACLTLFADTRVHVVSRNETLKSISRKYGVSVSDLARQNNLSPSAKLRIDQRLVIPGKPRAVSTGGSLQSAVAGPIQSANVKPGRWRHIVIHHSGTDFGNVRGMDRYHREQRNMENGLAYHFVIGNGRGMGNGEVAVGGRWTRQLDGGHLAKEELNRTSIGICLIGNFEKAPPSPQQLESLRRLVTALLDRCALRTSAVTTHQQIHPRHTQCPGRKFPTKSFLKSLPAG